MSNELLLDRYVLVHAGYGVVKDGKQLYDLDFVIEGPTENRSIGIRGYDHDLGMFVLGEKYQFVIRQVPDNHPVDLVSDPDVYSVSSISFIDEKRGAYTIEMSRVMVVDKTSYHVDLLLDNVPTNKFSGNLNDRFFVEIQPSQSALLDDFRHWTDCANHVLKQAIEKAKKPDCAKEEIAEIVDEVKRVYEVGLSKLEKTKSSSISNEVESTNCIADTRLSLKENTIDAISDIASFKSLISLGYMVDNALTAAMEEAKNPNCTKEDIAGILDKIKGAYGAIEKFNEFHNMTGSEQTRLIDRDYGDNLCKLENNTKVIEKVKGTFGVSEDLEKIQTKAVDSLPNSIKKVYEGAEDSGKEENLKTLRNVDEDTFVSFEKSIEQELTGLFKEQSKEVPRIYVGLFGTKGSLVRPLQIEFRFTTDRRDSLFLHANISEQMIFDEDVQEFSKALFEIALGWQRLQKVPNIKRVTIEDAGSSQACCD